MIFRIFLILGIPVWLGRQYPVASGEVVDWPKVYEEPPVEPDWNYLGVKYLHDVVGILTADKPEHGQYVKGPIQITGVRKGSVAEKGGVKPGQIARSVVDVECMGEREYEKEYPLRSASHFGAVLDATVTVLDTTCGIIMEENGRRVRLDLPVSGIRERIPWRPGLCDATYSALRRWEWLNAVYSLRLARCFLGVGTSDEEQRNAFQKGFPVLVKVFPGGRAAKAGLLPGDKLIRIRSIIVPGSSPSSSGNLFQSFMGVGFVCRSFFRFLEDYRRTPEGPASFLFEVQPGDGSQRTRAKVDLSDVIYLEIRRTCDGPRSAPPFDLVKEDLAKVPQGPVRQLAERYLGLPCHMASGRDCSDRNEDYLQILEESRVLETESGRPASRGEQILAARLSMVLSLRGRLDWSVALRALLSRVEALDGHVGVRDAVAAALLESAAAMKPEGWFPPPPVRLRDGFAAADGKAREFLERFVATLESCAKATGYLERLICLARANNLLGEIEDFLLATRANDGLAEQESWLICYQVACFLKRAVLGAITSPESLVPRLRSADDGVTAETIDAQVAAQAIRIGLESCEKVNLDGEPLVYAGVMFLDACEASWFAKRTMLSFADRYIRTYPTGPHLAHVLACRMNFLLNSNVIDQKEIERLRSVLSNVSDPMARDALALCDFRASWTQYEMNSSEEQLQQSLAILGRMRDTSGVRMICVRAFIPKEMWPRLPFPLTGLTTD